MRSVCSSKQTRSAAATIMASLCVLGAGLPIRAGFLQGTAGRPKLYVRERVCSRIRCGEKPMVHTETTVQRHGDAISTPDKLPVTMIVNGVEKRLRVAAWTTLLDVLRDHLDLTGTKKGCDHGQCGACTVLVHGRRINSCLTLAVMNDGAEVTTIEGLAGNGALHPLQQAFVDHDAFQCGYCTPGQICSAAGLIAEGRAKNADEIRELMSGNICRCGAYPNILAAIQQAMGQP
jgi:xanthine dehydrogenase YagT iron-sulfur-binding subunit